jgi:hypothetical protein
MIGQGSRQVAYNGVGGHIQDVLLALLAELAAEISGAAELVVADDPAVGKLGNDERQKVLCDSDLGPKSGRPRDVAGVQTNTASGPFMRKIEISVDERITAPSNVADEDPHLAIFLLPQTAAPLTDDADGVGTLLGETAGVEDQNSVGITEDLGDLAMKLASNVEILPLPLPDEPLQALARMMVRDGDRLDRFPVQVADEPLQIHLGELCLLLPIEERREGLGELSQLLERFSSLRWPDLGGAENLLWKDWNGQPHKSPSLVSLTGLSTSLSQNFIEKTGQ